MDKHRLQGCMEAGPGAKRRLDRLTAAALLAVFLLCAVFSLADGCYWGDDYAAYISEGMAIADHRLASQAELNSLMHPSPLPDEAVGKPLVYVWGYPLALALVYRLAGFERVSFSSVFFYKLPSVVAFALISAVLFLFLRRRFGYLLSLFLTVAFCSFSHFFSFLNTLYSDLYFLLFALLSLYVTELFLHERDRPRHDALGVVLGVVLWYMYEIRLNGIAVLLSCAFAHLLCIIKEKKHKPWPALLHELLPYIVFLVLKTSSEALLAAPTSNASDLRDCSLGMFLANLAGYCGLIRSFFAQLCSTLLVSPLYSVLRRFAEIEYSDLRFLSSALVWMSLALTVLGMLASGIRKNLHLTLLVIAYLAAASMLPYVQGMRYLYPLLPVFLLFFGYGIRFLSERIGPAKKTVWKKAPAVVVILLCALCFYQIAAADIRIRKEGLPESEIESVEDVYKQNAYSPAAVEAYRYIRANTPADCTIAFFAPRALYLNTERFSIKPDVNGHSIDEADYYLDYLNNGGYRLSPEPGEDFESIFSNDAFVLYKRIT